MDEWNVESTTGVSQPTWSALPSFLRVVQGALYAILLETLQQNLPVPMAMCFAYAVVRGWSALTSSTSSRQRLTIRADLVS